MNDRKTDTQSSTLDKAASAQPAQVATASPVSVEEQRAALIARKKARKKAAQKKVGAGRKRLAPTAAKKKTAPRPAGTNQTAARAFPTPDQTAATSAEPLNRVITAMEELRLATQEYVHRELQAQRQALLEFQQTARSTLKDLEDATLRTLRKMSS